MGLTEDQKKEIAKLYAKLYISRPDVVAVQHSSGAYTPHRGMQFSMPVLMDHLDKKATYGHYVLGTDSTCKFMCFDVDLVEIADPKKGQHYLSRLPNSVSEDAVYSDFQNGNPRAHWQSRQQTPARAMLKSQMKRLANKIARTITEELNIRVAVTYTGSKGIHVYGFVPRSDAQLVREGAQLVVDAMNCWEPYRGENFFRHKSFNDDPEDNFEQFSLEVFPKQSSLEGKELGNLIRLPLGTNLKSPQDPTFFVDMRTGLSDLSPMDPIEALTTDNIWR